MQVYDKKNEIKVLVVPKKGDSFFGKIYVDSNERLQDVLNDERSFLPIHKLMDERSKKEDCWRVVVYNKDVISHVEER